ncbi:hypothetical protein DIPPA_05742 [Diplonema papillatum]|nr:hypothetical protein DIPPA_05742 [Diplonema papillatum]
MLEAAGERCREATDRTEAIERHVKDLNKLVTEIHERLFPKGAHAVGGPPAVSLLGHSSLASMRGRTVPDVLDHWSTNNA